MKLFSEITTIINESSTKLSSATNQVYKSLITNNNCHQLLMKSPSEITSIINESSTKLPSATDQVSKSKSSDPTLINNNDLVISILKIYELSMYYNFYACLSDNNNIKIYVRRSITLNIRVEGVEDSNMIEFINLLSSNCFVINDIRDCIVKFNNKYVYTRQSIVYNGTVRKINHWIQLF